MEISIERVMSIPEKLGFRNERGEKLTRVADRG